MNEEQKLHTDRLVSLLYQKGYRGPFTIRVFQSGRPMHSGDLRRLLAYFFQSKNEHISQAELTTHAPYAPHIQCRMQVAYSGKEGFVIKELLVTNKQSRESRHLQFGHNQQLPGSMSIEGLFPKPKPWDNLLKGKGFRP